MKNKVFILIAAGLVSLSMTANAVNITGQVDMSGTAILDSQNLGTATAVNSFVDAEVIPTPTGSFVGTEGSAVTYSTFSWAPANTPITPLWSFVDNGMTFQFDLDSLQVLTQNSAFLNLTGQGTLDVLNDGGLYDPTPGTWTFTITVAGGGDRANFDFGFVSSTAAPRAVPDGGLTVALLGFALVGVEGLRRKLSK